MRHGRAGYRLGRRTAHRTAMLRNLAAGLFEHGQIVTTIPKAKALQPFVEKIITLAKRGDLSSRRLVIARLGGDRRGFEWLYMPKKPSDAEKERMQQIRDQHAPFFELPQSSEVERNRYGELRRSPKLVKHIFDRVAPKFAERQGGYTRIVKLGKWRIGDAGELCLIQFVGNEEGAEIGGQVSSRRRIADRRTAYYASLRKGGAEAAPAQA
ncbi:MAG: 50S ribosomal protein L17 [Phycisphaeraceae bacterium]|nr:50S ribosomal protein L17 [Phycisphaeraceae bacterium]